MVKGELRTPENAAIILDLLEEGKSVLEIANNYIGCDEKAIRKWAREDADFGPKYAQAREFGHELNADKIVALAMSATPENCNAVRLQVDTLKWHASKMLPKVYGEKVDVQHSGEVLLVKHYVGIDTEKDI